MRISRLTSVLLVLFGVWSWLIWPRFAVAIWQDGRSWSDGDPTSFFWVHAAIVVASLSFGTAIGVLGVRGWMRSRSVRTHRPGTPEADGRRAEI